jgi:hypothetical protein
MQPDEFDPEAMADAILADPGVLAAIDQLSAALSDPDTTPERRRAACANVSLLAEACACELLYVPPALKPAIVALVRRRRRNRSRGWWPICQPPDDPHTGHGSQDAGQ